MKTIKCYLIFTSGMYRILMFAIMPLFMLGINELGIHFSGEGMWLVIPVLAAILEIFADNLIFGGICSKESISMEFFKTSVRGEEVLKRGLAIDLARKFLTLTVLSGICFLRGIKGSQINAAGIWNGIILAAAVCVWSYGVSVLGVIINRFLTIRVWCWISSMAGGLFLMSVINMINMLPVLFLVLGITAGMAVSVLSVSIVLGKVRKSYYDEKC